MKFFASAFAALLVAASPIDAFVPSPSFTATMRSGSKISMVDPSAFHDLPQHIDSMQSAFSSLMISDEVAASAASAVADVASNAGAAVEPAAASNGGGWFGFLAGPIEGLLQIIHSVLVGVGLDSNAWGVSIIGLTVLVKAVTYPLTKRQIESTTKTQMLQPQIKEIQAKYQSNPEIMQQKVGEFYQANNVDPFAGCLPAIVQLPVFVGLYRAVSTLANENKLDEPFLFLPSLEGPVYGADPGKGNAWITSGWHDGVPSLGWEDTIAFLSIPAFLILTTAISQQLTLPKNPTPEQEAQQNNIVLKILPVFFGLITISVPSALGLYFVTNNIITTLFTLQIRSSMDSNPPVVASSGGGGAAANVVDAPTSSFTPAPMREKPAGFASAAPLDTEVTPITPIDAEVIEGEEVAVTSEVPRAPSRPSKKKRKGRKKK